MTSNEMCNTRQRARKKFTDTDMTMMKKQNLYLASASGRGDIRDLI